jgi:hypothetical protein
VGLPSANIKASVDTEVSVNVAMVPGTFSQLFLSSFCDLSFLISNLSMVVLGHLGLGKKRAKMLILWLLLF